MIDLASARRRRQATTAGVVVGLAVHLLILSNRSFDLFRTAVAQGYASNFFDLQALAFLNGRVWVPTKSLGIEGFIVDGRTYMYFPPFPALLRMPVLWASGRSGGNLTLISMAVATTVFVVMVVRLFWLVRQILRGDAPLGRIEAVLAGLFLAAALGGTTFTFDGSLPWVYHEVYMWAVALAVGTMYWLIRSCRETTPRNLVWLGGFAAATIMTRSTGGLGMCIAIAIAVVWVRQFRPEVPARMRQWLLACSVAPLGISVAYNIAKFGTPVLFPLQKQVWTDVNEQRRIALAANDGKLSGPQFFPSDADAYLNPTGIRFTDHFPWVTLPADPAASFNGAVLDQTYRTGSITAFMPFLCLLSVLALVVLWRRRRSPETLLLGIVVIGGVLVTSGVMSYGYIANRYTSEFVPALVIGGSIGTIGLARLLARVPPPGRALVSVIAGVLVAFSLYAQWATAFAIEATTSRGDDLVRYVTLQHKLSPHALADVTSRTDDVRPSGGEADDLLIRGDCDELYLNTGDAYEPWVTVEQKDLVLDLTSSDVVRKGTARLFTVITPDDTYELKIETDGRGRARFILDDTKDDLGRTFWFTFTDDSKVTFGTRNVTDLAAITMQSTPGGYIGAVPSYGWNVNWDASPSRFEIDPNVGGTTWTGVDVSMRNNPPPALCASILADLP